MKLSEKTNESGLVEEVNRICGTTNSIYSLKAKIARLNDALNRYIYLVFCVDRKGSFDDSNNLTAPIETQTLVTATNSYKFSAFTNEVLNMLRLAVLDGAGKEVTLKHETLDDINEIGEFANLYSTDVTGTPTHWTRLGDFIYVRPCPLTGNFTASGGLRAYVERTNTRFEFIPVTVTIASPGVFSATAHGLVAGDTVVLETDGALPTGLTADTVQYFVISTGLTADAFRVSLTLGGTVINTSGSQSGNHTFVKTSKQPGIPSIHHPYLARHASIPFLIEKTLPQLGGVLGQVQLDEESIKKHFASREKDLQDEVSGTRIDAR